MTIFKQTKAGRSILAKKMKRFLQKPWPEKLRAIYHVLGHTYRRLMPHLVRPVRLPCGAWLLAWPDVMGRNLRRGGFEENEWHFVEWFLKPGMAVLDVGAHIGFYTLLAARQVGDAGCVVAFEPSPRERRRLRWNLAINRCRNVRVEPFALGEYNGQTDFFVVLGQETGCNSMHPPAVDDPVRCVTVPVVTLDHYLSQSRIRVVDFLKLDAEGAELAVLKGARGLLTTQPRPVLMCELVDMRTEPWNYRAQEIYEFLAQLSYIWFSVAQGGYLCPAPKKDHYHENLVAVPEERMYQVKDWIRKE